MGWDKNDDQFGIHRKVIRIPKKTRLAAVGLWALTKNYSARALTDGVIEAHELDELDAPATLIAELVRVELWHRGDAVCEKCVAQLAEKGHTSAVPADAIVIHDYLDYNPSRKEALAAREKERVRKASQRASTRSPSGTPTGSDLESDHPVPVPVPSPVPSPLTDVTYLPGVSPDPAARESGISPELALLVEEREFIRAEADKLALRDVPKARRHLEAVVGPMPADDAFVIELVRAIVMLALAPVTNADGYIRTTCENSPAEVQAQWATVQINSPMGAVA
jgi:hypothetical protein